MKRILLKLIYLHPFITFLFHKSKRVVSRIIPKNTDLLFIFSGRSFYWENIGKELYETEPIFRDSILKSDEIIKELGWPSIISNFVDNNPVDFFESESNVYLTIAAIQIAVFDYFKQNGIIPRAIMGLSLGETPGLYAAGAITRKEVFIMGLCVKISNLYEKKKYVSVLINLDVKNVTLLSKEFKNIHPVYEFTSNSTIILIDENDFNEVKANLKQRNINLKVTSKEKLFPYHSSNLENYKEELLNTLAAIDFKPLAIDYFSASLGKIISKGTILSKEFFFNMLRNPVLADSTFKEIGKNGKNFDIVQVGPNIFGDNNLQNILSSNDGTNGPLLLSTITKTENKIYLNKTLKNIKKNSQTKNKNHSKLNEFDVFLENFTLDNPHYINNPQPFWNYFKKQGAIHFLPKNNCWLVLGYDEITHVLKDPENFSSKAASYFDQYLLGNDPPSHKPMRGMLQSLFSQSNLNIVEVFITKKVEDLINDFPKDHPFNFVDYFSLPLSKSVIGYFLGLNDEQSQTANNIIGEDVFKVNDDLKDYFYQQFENNVEFNSYGALNYLTELYKEENISLDAAASLARLFWVAGMLTTSVLLSHSFLKLLDNPEIAKQLRESEELINKFIDECLRVLPPETSLSRIASRDVEIFDKKIASNSLVCLDLRAGNHDAKKFEDPFNFSLKRPTNSHLSFGTGVHVCIGMALAKLEARIAIKSYLNFIEKNNPIQTEPIVYYPSNNIRGLKNLTINLKT